MSSNIGSVARVMHNFSQTDLRLVAPAQEWLNDKAIATATHASFLLNEAKIYNTVEEAVADLDTLFALTARTRFINKPMHNVNQITAKIDTDSKLGIIFGPENSGLSNDDLVLVDKLFNIPTNPKFSSLNLAQAVAVTLYAASTGEYKNTTSIKSSPKASKEELASFFEHLHQALKPTHFFQEKNKEATMLRNIKNIFSRIENLSTQEVNTLRGIITELSKKNLHNN